MSTATMSTDTTSSDKILAKKNGPIGHLIINNPEKRNAISLDMSVAAASVLDGMGDKAFASGADISKFEQARATKEDVARYNQTSERFRTLLKTSAKP